MSGPNSCRAYQSGSEREVKLIPRPGRCLVETSRDCYAENAICHIDDVITAVKGFQGRSRRIANII